jgi:hypothetical protein
MEQRLGNHGRGDRGGMKWQAVTVTFLHFSVAIEQSELDALPTGIAGQTTSMRRPDQATGMLTGVRMKRSHLWCAKPMQHRK